MLRLPRERRLRNSTPKPHAKYSHRWWPTSDRHRNGKPHH